MKRALAAAVAMAFCVAGCTGKRAPENTSTAPVATAGPLVGRVERSAIETLPAWAAARSNAQIDDATARALRDVPPGATVRVFLGTWCGDSVREVSRLWEVLDADRRPLPFAIEYIAVDREFSQPAELIQGVGLQAVPTFVVVRGNREVGRIVESAPNGIERDLAALLRGG